MARMLAFLYAGSHDTVQGAAQRLSAAGSGSPGQAPCDRRGHIAVRSGRAGAVRLSEGGAMRVRPVRFTDDVAAMRRFLEALGLRPRIASDNGGWVNFLTKESGGAALHEAATATSGYKVGETSLSFES